MVKEQGGDNDLVERIQTCPYFAPIHGKLHSILDSSTFIGRAPEQVRSIKLFSECWRLSPVSAIRSD